jgi:hypothetical protein
LNANDSFSAQMLDIALDEAVYYVSVDDDCTTTSRAAAPFGTIVEERHSSLDADSSVHVLQHLASSTPNMSVMSM